MLTVENFCMQSPFRTHAHTKQPTIQNSTFARTRLLVGQGTQLFPNVHSYFGTGSQTTITTQTFHHSKSASCTKIERLGWKELVFGNVFFERPEHLRHTTITLLYLISVEVRLLLRILPNVY